MPGIGTLGGIAGGVVLGLGLLWWFIRQNEQKEKADIDAASQKNWNIGQQEAKAAEDAARKASDDAKSGTASSSPTDW